MATSVKYSGWKRTSGQTYISAFNLGVESLRLVGRDFQPLGDITIANAKNIIVNTTTGTKIGTATTQKLGFWNAAPVAQQAHVADPSGGATVDAEARTAINSINALCATLGLTAAS